MEVRGGVRSRAAVALLALAAVVLVALVPAACERPAARSAPREPALFEALPPSATGITFANELPESPEFNILNYLYYYNGGGVAVGDVDGDSLPDLYLTSNLGPDRLYRNRGGFRFEDVTERAGVAGPPGWTSGAAMADVDGDGHLDIYVSAVSYLTMHGRNVLYINDGDGTFTDRTKEYGLEHEGYSTQAAFLDYDVDGDLDMYLLNNSVHSERGASVRPQREVRHPKSGDKLFRNDRGRFVDVSAKAGIHGGVEGYGLGVVASDLDGNGCPDLYVANDFQENDFLYLNDCDGTFTESIGNATGHTSRFSMGVDAADLTNDGRPDLVVVDMLPDREDVLKTSASSESLELYERRVRAGYHPQFARNTLQINRGVPAAGAGQGPRFSDAGYLAGVHATDWSWAPLIADLDDDGRKDLFVTTGIYRRPNDLDYIDFVGNAAIQASLARGVTASNLRLIDTMPRVPVPNAAFRNEGGLRFTSVADAWGLAEPGFSNGAAYADLDNDGALDLVVSNINAPASVYRNRARERTGNHWLAVRLRGAGANTAGIGATLVAWHDGERQWLEQSPTRGFQSSVDPTLHFGLGRSSRLDSLVVVWPDRRFQTLRDVAADRTITLSQAEAAGRWAPARAPARALLADATEGAGLDFAHRENPFHDFSREPLMPHLLSTEGPALATGDVNGDGLDDVFLGGAKWQSGRLFLQRADGRFAPAPDQGAFAADSTAEDVDAAFFDADGDGDRDLYVVSGGNEFWGDVPALADRLYLNDGKGGFRRDAGALPARFENGGCVAPGDFDGDGDVDLFVGARVVARAYGTIPRSALLRNDGRGRFADVTAEIAPELASAGMVSSAAWIDDDGDRKLDLVVVGEWMPVRVFRQEGGRLTDRTARAGLAETSGWWSSVTTADLNGDGRQDLVLGNLGLNSYLKASPEEPARLYVHDFFGTGSLKQILTFYRHGVAYPLAGRDELVRAMPALRSRYPSYRSFGASRIEDVVPKDELKRAQVRQASYFASAVALSRPDGRFAIEALPPEAQLAPVYAALAEDVNGDGKLDLLLGGNFYGVQPVRGRYDASYGLLLRGRGDGRFDAVDMAESGVNIAGQVRGLAAVRRPGGRAVVVARNDTTPLLLAPGR